MPSKKPGESFVLEVLTVTPTNLSILNLIYYYVSDKMACFSNSILTDKSLISHLLEPQVVFLTHNRSFDSHFHGDSDAYSNSIFKKKRHRSGFFRDGHNY